MRSLLLILSFAKQGVSELFSKLPRCTQQVFGRVGVHTPSSCGACTFKDSNSPHSLGPFCPQLSRLAGSLRFHTPWLVYTHLSNHWRLGISWTEYHISIATRAAKEQRNWTWQLAPPSLSALGKSLKAMRQLPLAPNSCHPFMLFTRGGKLCRQLLAPTL